MQIFQQLEPDGLKNIVGFLFAHPEPHGDGINQGLITNDKGIKCLLVTSQTGGNQLCIAEFGIIRHKRKICEGLL
jgi:hypothetical protein